MSIEDGFYSPLFKCARTGNIVVARDLIEQGYDVNHRDEHNNTPLHFAIAGKKPKMVAFLIEKGADINAVNNYNTTPLKSAAEVFLPEIIKILVEKGADVNKADYRGDTPLRSLANVSSRPMKMFIADDPNSPENSSTIVTINQRMTENDAKNITNPENPSGVKVTQMEIPSRYKGSSLESIKLLLEYGANPNRGNNHNWTPLHQLVSKNNFEAVKLLVESGADVNTRDTLYNRTPLMVALQYSFGEIAEYLLKKGARIDGNTMKYAAMNNDEKMINLVKRYRGKNSVIGQVLGEIELNAKFAVGMLIKRFLK